MAQTGPLIATLKKRLKAQGKTYADVASALELSEASVKRLFAEQNFTLLRIEKICQMLNMELSELMEVMVSERHSVTQLSREQEQVIVSDTQLLLIAVCVINGYSYENLLAEYQLDPHQCLQHLVVLDRLKIIELLPGNRIKLLVSPDFSWLPNGPIQQLFQQRVEQDFFNSAFDKNTESLIVVNGLLSEARNAEFQKKMRRLASEFTELCQQDKHLSINDRNGATVVIALRQWQYSLFERYKTAGE